MNLLTVSNLSSYLFQSYCEDQFRAIPNMEDSWRMAQTGMRNLSQEVGVSGEQYTPLDYPPKRLALYPGRSRACFNEHCMTHPKVTMPRANSNSRFLMPWLRANINCLEGETLYSTLGIDCIIVLSHKRPLSIIERFGSDNIRII